LSGGSFQECSFCFLLAALGSCGDRLGQEAPALLAHWASPSPTGLWVPRPTPVHMDAGVLGLLYPASHLRRQRVSRNSLLRRGQYWKHEEHRSSRQAMGGPGPSREGVTFCRSLAGSPRRKSAKVRGNRGG
jgi:hypothetical protein